MDVNSWKHVILLLFTIYSCVCDRLCRRFSSLYKNLRIDDHDNLLRFPSRIQCALFCQLEHSCFSFAYGRLKQECYVYNRRLGRKEATKGHPGLATFIARTGNVALDQSASQSSMLGSVEWPYKGVDGVFGDNSKIQTHLEQRPWWCVDLWRNYDISHIVIYNRHGYYGYRLRYFELHVSSIGDCTVQNLDSSSLCFKNDGKTKNIYNITSCNRPSSLDNVRSVYINIYNENLHFEELQVFPKELCSG